MTLQWDKLRRSGSLPHLGRWFELVSTEALLKEVADKYGPKKPSSRTEFRKELAAAGMGGGGETVSVASATLFPRNAILHFDKSALALL